MEVDVLRLCETLGQLLFSRHLDKKFGGPNTVLVQIIPTFKRYDSNGPPIYCNFKLKMSPFGIMFGTGDEFKVDEEMSNVSAIEVWGCAGSETFQKQKSQKLWLQKEAEKKNKVSHKKNSVSQSFSQQFVRSDLFVLDGC